MHQTVLRIASDRSWARRRNVPDSVKRRLGRIAAGRQRRHRSY